MKALRLNAWKSDPVLEDVPVPEPGPGEVLVQVGGAGACHSDLHLMHEFEAGILPWAPPFTLGHENAGWVHTLGVGVQRLRGRRAGGRRRRLGLRLLRALPGRARDVLRPARPGARARRRRRPRASTAGWRSTSSCPSARHLVRLPDGLDPVHAAPLTDAGLTPYHAVRRSREKLGPTSTAVVIGVGGLGHLAVQILKATTAARIIAVDPRDTARDLGEAQRRGPGAGARATTRQRRSARRAAVWAPTS